MHSIHSNPFIKLKNQSCKPYATTKVKPTKDLYTRRSICILKAYFLIHGVGFNAASKKHFSRKIFTLFLAFFYEINSWLYFHIAYLRDDMTQSRNIIKMVCNFLFYLLNLMQRYYLYKRDINLIDLLKKTLHICNQMPSNNSTKKFSLRLFIFVFSYDAFRINLELFYYIFISSKVHYDRLKILNSVNYPKIFVYLTFFCMNWKTVNSCTAAYFYTICFILKSCLIGIEKFSNQYTSQISDFILLYNKITEITKEFNDMLQVIFFSTFAFSLGLLFYDAFNMINNDIISDLFYRALNLILPLTCFLIICLSASSLSNAGKNAKNILKKLRNIRRKKEIKTRFPKISEEYLGFTIFDSIIIDKSFIMSSFTGLLTYGVMIATFNQTQY